MMIVRKLAGRLARAVPMRGGVRPPERTKAHQWARWAVLLWPFHRQRARRAASGRSDLQ
jgi:hypothetical protein